MLIILPDSSIVAVRSSSALVAQLISAPGSTNAAVSSALRKEMVVHRATRQKASSPADACSELQQMYAQQALEQKFEGE